MKKKLISFDLAMALVFNFCVIVPAFAVDNSADEFEVVLAADKTDYKPGDTVHAALKLENYKQGATKIAGFQIQMSANTDEFVLSDASKAEESTFPYSVVRDGDSVKLLGINVGAATEDEQVMPYGDVVLANFELTVRADLTADELNKALFDVQKLTFSDIDANAVEGISMQGNQVNVLATVPKILLNGQEAQANAVFAGEVTVTSDKANASITLTKDGAEYAGSVARENGSYVATATDPAGNASSAAFRIQKREITGIAVSKLPKTEYFTGEALDLTGGSLTVSYSDGTTETVSMTVDGVEVQTPDMTAAGTKTVALTYQGQQTSFEIQVKAVAVTELQVDMVKNFVQGTEFAPQGTYVRVYNNGTVSEPIALTADLFTVKPDMDALGKQTITLTDAESGVSLDIEVTILAKQAVSIVLTEAPTPTAFVEGESFTVESGRLQVTYDNGTTETVELTADMCTGFDGNTVGEQTITVNYAGQTTTYTVTVTAKTATSIQVEHAPDVMYNDGTMDTSDMVVTATYNNGETQVVKDYTLSFRPAEVEIGDEVTVTVSYQGQTASFKVSVVQGTLTGIEVEQEPNCTTYVQGQDLDLTGGVLSVLYTPGKTETLSMTDASVICTGYNKDQLGTQTVLLSYQGFTAALDVTVEAKTVSSLEITHTPNRVEYSQGEALDTTGLAVTAHYNDNSQKKLTAEDCTVSGYDAAAVGQQTVTVSYGGQSAAFTVTVKEKEIASISIATMPQTEFVEGEAFQVTGGVLNVTYKGSNEISSVPMTVDMCSAPNMNQLGEQTVTVQFAGAVTSYTIQIVPTALTSIEVTAMPNKLQYLQGTKLDLTGLIVTAHYDNGNTADVTAQVTADYDFNQVGDAVPVTLSYEGKSTSFDVEVVSRARVDSVITMLEDCMANEIKADRELYALVCDVNEELQTQTASMTELEKEAIAEVSAEFDAYRQQVVNTVLPVYSDQLALDGKLWLSADAGQVFYDETVAVTAIDAEDAFLARIRANYGEASQVLAGFKAQLLDLNGEPVVLDEDEYSVLTYSFAIPEADQNAEEFVVLVRESADGEVYRVKSTVENGRVVFSGNANMEYTIVKAAQSAATPEPEDPSAGGQTPEDPSSSGGSSTPTRTPASPKTGDSSLVLALFGIMALAAASAGTVVLRKKKSR